MAIKRPIAIENDPSHKLLFLSHTRFWFSLISWHNIQFISLWWILFRYLDCRVFTQYFKSNIAGKKCDQTTLSLTDTNNIASNTNGSWKHYIPSSKEVSINHEILQDSERDLTMKFWRLMGFMTTGGPAVRGHDWNFLSVSSHHSLFATVWGVVPEYNN